MKPNAIAILALAPATCAIASGGDLSCYEEPGTRKTTCISESEARANGSTRSSPVYMGGPNSVRKSSFILIADCARGISTLQDKDGVNFAGGSSNTTKTSRALTQWLCEIPKVRTDPRLRQF